MSKSIILDNGFEYKSCWANEQYHDLTKITVNDMDWIKEYQIDPNHPTEDFAHHDYYSCCGNYHIKVYINHWKEPEYFLYKCSTWRKNMQSTFGNCLPGYRAPFKSFEEAAFVAYKHKNEN